MTQPNVANVDRTHANAAQALAGHWKSVCSRRDLVANSGIVVWFDGAQIALFYLPETDQGEKLFALDNRDPKSGANVIVIRGACRHVGIAVNAVARRACRRAWTRCCRT